MAKSKEQFKQIRDQRYEEISNAALKVFARKGFAATKISEITSSVNLSHGLFYHYFESKEHLYISLISNVLDLFIDSVEEAAKKEGTPKDQLEWLTELTYSGSLENALSHHTLVIEALQSEFLPKDIKQEFVQKFTASLEGICRIIKKGQEEGIFVEGDPMELAVYYQSLTQGLTLWNARGLYPIKVSLERVMRLFEA
ncbi:TetR/AcrR family transcriptional regulator [Bacillus sp. S/N-304-OC-R1]|uniref:TetR/AcrR family transcriptional regulator n=1 Tax=Bacillus sp. S/N-304-OC-R1 TaxID=2758034 RepID=UPI001C8F07BD|nr:TetR/AcrR family transcriptional regulator [Bacillus sp. S/N-304-OC-R1]MBY0121550.1 TetR/AcrR family transcriptional regulator [Bacillus sp. S/N-304-OC-R1]